jgi:hypothetical protein
MTKKGEWQGDLMVYRGHVQNGVVVLEDPAKLEEGQSVSVSLRRGRRAARRKPPLTTLSERFKPLIGIAKGLPRDFSSQLDHYLYDTPKTK